MLQKVMSGFTTPISKFKANPNAALSQAEGEAVAVSSHNEIQFYAVPAELYEKMMEFIELAKNGELSQPPIDIPAREISTDFLAAQIAGSCRIEGIKVTAEDEQVMRDVIDGKVDVESRIDDIIADFQSSKTKT